MTTPRDDVSVPTPINTRPTVAGGVTKATAAQKTVLIAPEAAAPIGPYSQGIKVGNLIFVAGEKGVDVKTGTVVPGGIAAETRQTLENVKAILVQGGATLDDAVAATVHMTDLGEFAKMNEVFSEYFRKDPPGRTTVQVTALPGGARVEITVIAVAST